MDGLRSWNVSCMADLPALLRDSLQRLAERCPRLVRTCYWAGTSAIATEELGHRVSLERYLADKIQCVAERAEARDLVDLAAVFEQRPALKGLARRVLGDRMPC